MRYRGLESTLNLAGSPPGDKRTVETRAAAAIVAALRGMAAGIRGDHRAGAGAVRASRLARRAGRRHRAAGALPDSPRQRRGRRAGPARRRPDGAHALGGDQGPSRPCHGPSGRRRDRANVLQFGHPPRVQHGGRGRGHRVSRSRHPGRRGCALRADRALRPRGRPMARCSAGCSRATSGRCRGPRRSGTRSWWPPRCGAA